MFDKPLAFVYNGNKYVITAGDQFLLDTFNGCNAVPVMDTFATGATMVAVSSPWKKGSPADIPTINEGADIKKVNDTTFEVYGEVQLPDGNYIVSLNAKEYDVVPIGGEESESVVEETPPVEETADVEDSTGTEEEDIPAEVMEIVEEVANDRVKQEDVKSEVLSAKEINSLLDAVSRSEVSEEVYEQIHEEDPVKDEPLMFDEELDTEEPHTGKVTIGGAVVPAISRGFKPANKTKNHGQPARIVSDYRPTRIPDEMTGHCIGDAFCCVPHVKLTKDGDVLSVTQGGKPQPVDKPPVMAPVEKAEEPVDTTLKEVSVEVSVTSAVIEEDTTEKEEVAPDEPTPAVDFRMEEDAPQIHSMSGAEVMEELGVTPIIEPIQVDITFSPEAEDFLEKLSDDVKNTLVKIPLYCMESGTKEFTNKLVDTNALKELGVEYCILQNWHCIDNWYFIDVLPTMCRYFYNAEVGVSTEIPLATYKRWRVICEKELEAANAKDTEPEEETVEETNTDE